MFLDDISVTALFTLSYWFLNEHLVLNLIGYQFTTMNTVAAVISSMTEIRGVIRFNVIKPLQIHKEVREFSYSEKNILKQAV